MGNRLVIVLGSQDAIREALVRQADNFSGRPHFHFANQGINGREDIIQGEGDIWRKYRQFSLATIKSIGTGTATIEQRIKEEIGYFLSALGKYESQPYDVDELLSLSVGNVIWSILFGQRAGYDDPDFRQLITLLDEFTKGLSIHKIQEYLPILLKIPGIAKMAGFMSVKQLGMKMDTLLQKKVMDHKSPYTNRIKADFVDAWLTEEMNMAEPDTFTNENLVKVLRSLIVAGTDTIAHTLRWALLFMIAHPQVQKKIQQELDDVIPNLQALSYQESRNLPYTLATLMEVQRRVPVLPLSIAHSNFKETHLFGHLIPKRSIVLPNIYAVHHNAQVFPNPEQFLPERFLDDTTRKKKMDHLMPFSMGKRQCLGEELALMELMLYFSSMLRCFHFSAPEGKTVSFESINSSVLVAKPFKLVVTPRYNRHLEKIS